MKTTAKTFTHRASVIAVQGAIAAMAVAPCAWAADAIDPAELAEPGEMTMTLPPSDTVDAAMAEWGNPVSTVEFGIGNLSRRSFKANEYTGLKNKGAYLIGNIDLRGGGAFGSEDSTRWRVLGTNLGTDSRSLKAEYSQQGRFKIFLGYDELLRNGSDSYQTPLLGAGTNTLTLPSTWLVPLVPRVSATAPNLRGLSPSVTSSNALVNGVSIAPTAAQTAISNNIQAADLPLFQNVDLYTKRTKYDLGATYLLGGQWEFSASFQHEDKVGMKPMGTVSRATGGGDLSMTIPDPIDQSIEQVNVGVQFNADKLILQGAYYGSMFSNKVSSVSWTDWALPSSVQTMSTAPTNQFHQFNLTGTYSFTPTTRIVGNASYARGTQNDSYLVTTSTPLVPVNSLEGLVVTKALNLKLTSRPIKDLHLIAAYKFDDRDNRTAINTYGFYDAGEAKAGTSSFAAMFPTLSLGSNSNFAANQPYSKKLNQLSLDGEYQIARGHNLQAGFESQSTDYHCNGSWVACADASTTKEHTFRLDWRGNSWDSITAHVGLAHSSRSVDYNEDAWLSQAPAANWAPTGATGYNASFGTAYSTMGALGLTGYGPVAGLTPSPAAGTAAAFFFANNNTLSNSLYGRASRISELRGMRRYNLADRLRDTLRASLEWQATDQLTMRLGVDVNQDDYAKSVYGLQKGTSQGLNLDATLALSDAANINAYVSQEEFRNKSAGNGLGSNSATANVNGFTTIADGCFATIALRNASAKIDPCLNWTTDMRDTVNTLGATYTHKGLLDGKLDLNGGLSVSQARSTNDVSGGSYANNPLAVTGAAAGTVAAYYIAATAMPVVTTNTLEFKLAGKYALNKESAVRLGYRYQHMSSNDWMYEGMQTGGLTGVMPTNEQAPNYTVHTVTVSYQYTFR